MADQPEHRAGCAVFQGFECDCGLVWKVPERRHDEEAYINLRTLDALVKTGHSTAIRVWDVLRLLTRIRLNAPELWVKIVEFVDRER